MPRKRPHRCLACGSATLHEHPPHIERLLRRVRRMTPREVEQLVYAEEARQINMAAWRLRADGSIPDGQIDATINECIQEMGGKS